jgi:hypothetical protein
VFVCVLTVIKGVTKNMPRTEGRRTV